MGLDHLVSSSPMLSFCTANECTTIVFGQGACVEHDRRPLTMADRLLDQAVSQSEQTQRPADTLSASS
jgi:hypothetical protein